MKSEPLGGIDVTQSQLHEYLARRRLYVHTARWTSLGLSLIEAMSLGLPVAVLSTTEAAEVIPYDVGVKTNDIDCWVDGIRMLMNEPEEATLRGKRARAFALRRLDWNVSWRIGIAHSRR